jgi:hypothetical protein
VTPDTILRWYCELIAKKYDGTSQRDGGRPGRATSLQRMVVQLAPKTRAGATPPLAIAFALAGRCRMLVVGLFGISLHLAAIVRSAIVRGRSR